MREFERAIERGEDAAVATFVLEELRKVVRGTDEPSQPRADDPARLLFRPLEPFLIDGNFPRRPGQIRRASLLPVWQWLVRDGAPDPARDFEAALNAARDREIRRRMRRRFAPSSARRPRRSGHCLPAATALLARVGGPDVLEDLLPIGAVLAGPRGDGNAQWTAASAISGRSRNPRSAPSRRAQCSRPANAATVAVCAVAGDAAAVRAVADHPPGYQDGGIRR